MNGKTTRISPRTGVIFAAALIAVMTTSALAQTPTENTRIGNQASATYENALGDSFTVTSNLVETVVQEVLGVDIAPAALGQNANPGSTVSYGHTITNTGNGSEAFDLSYSEAGPFTCDPPGPQAFADMSPQDGVPDNPAAPITQTPALGAGASYSIVVTCTIPATATAGQSHALTITAAAASDGAVNDIAVDTTTVTNDAVINITKAFVPAVAVADGSTQYEVRLSYRNDGNTTSNRVVITDDLDARLSYVGGSGLWSGSATPLSDAAGASPPDTDPAGIEYEYNGGTARVTAILDSVAPGQSGTITFRVTVPVGTAAGPIPNVANYQYDEDADGTVDQVAPGFSTNTANLTVSNAPSVTFVGETIAAANQGDAVTFTNVLTNTGNATDTFDITLDTSSFGAGVSFTLYQGDGVTPLVDTNGNSIPDTGPVAAGGTYNVVLVVQLDPSATGGPYSVDKIATSANDPGVSATATDTLTNISGSVVDLTNDSTFNAGTPAPGQGVNPTGEASPVNTNSATGGSTTSFTLFVNNRSAVTDSYNLAASTDNTFATISLPAGWTVTFVDPGSGSTITNTGPIAAGAAAEVRADVTIPAGESPGTTSLYFRAQSPSTGATDVKHDAVDIAATRSVQVTPDNSGQVSPGGSVVYEHTLSNNGNITENSTYDVDGDGTLDTLEIALSATNSLAGWTTVLYLDDGDGVFGATDTVITGPGDLPALAPGASVTIWARVNSPAGATVGQINSTDVTATTTGGPSPPPVSTATDTTTVVPGNLDLNKEQAADASCDGTADAPYGTADISVAPGECILYRLTLENIGTEDALNTVLSDSTPPFTAMEFEAFVSINGAPATSVTTQPTLPPTPGTGLIQESIGVMSPLDTAVMTFGVRVNGP